jgi:hypothetical protein
MNKTGEIRDHVKAHPGATDEAIIAATGLDRDFVRTVLGQRVKRGEFRRDKAGGYSINAAFVIGKHKRSDEGGVPRIRGNRAELRAQRRAAKSGQKKSPKVLHVKRAPAAPNDRDGGDLGELARKVLSRPAAQSLTIPLNEINPHLLHVRTTAQAFALAIDAAAFGPMAATAWRAHQEALALLDSAACPF